LQTDWVKPNAYAKLLNLARTYRLEIFKKFDRSMIEAAAREVKLE
jgi:hypothetical protein